MVSLDPTIEGWLRSAYARGPGEVDFVAVLAHFDVSENDEQLAELIELDGRVRIQLGKPVTLGRYLEDTPGLHHKPVSLDAAIDMTLRSMRGSSRPTQDAVRILAEQFPGIKSSILNAAMLADAMGTTTGLHKQLGLNETRALPAEFGPPLESGQSRYELLQLLGQGGGGEVYLAEDRKLSDPTFKARVAIKVVPYNSQTGWVRRQLIEEATKARRVDHPNVVKVLDRGISADGEEYVVSEFVDGPNLDAWFHNQRTPLNPTVAANVVAQLARGVQAAHAAGLVHCDLKPSNVLMSPNGPKVADFGIAVLAQDQNKARVESDENRVVGSLAFMSPEQYRGEGGALTIPSDIYALGGMLFYLLTGILPNGASPEQIAQVHAGTEGARFPARDAALAGADRDLVAICLRALRSDRAERHHSAGELAEDLERWARFEPITWTKPNAKRSIHLWRKRNPKLVRAIVASSVLLIGATIVAGRMTAVAQQERAKATAATGVNHKALSKLKGWYQQFSDQRADAVAKDFLPQSMALELMRGSLDPGASGSQTDAWRDRVRSVQTLIKKNIDEGNGATLETALWQMTLGCWLLNENKPADAIEPLEACTSFWSSTLPPSDPTFVECRTCLAAARVLAWRGEDDLGNAIPPPPQILEAARTVLHPDAGVAKRQATAKTWKFWQSARKKATQIDRHLP